MKMTYLYGALVIALVVVLVLVRNSAGEHKITTSATSVYDTFAQCIADSGAKFYGAYWCPHCKDQKELFKNSKKLPYIECSTTDGQGQTKACIEAKVESYPTWILSDGTRLGGLQTFATLAEKTGCSAPQE